MRKLLVILCFLLLSFSLAEAATYTVTQDGSGADYSAVTFNALSGDKSDDTFYFSGAFTSTITVAINGTSGHPVTLDGYQAGDCDPINAECTSSADLQKGLYIGTSTIDPDYVTVQDFRVTRNDGKTYPAFRIYSSGGGDLDYLIIKRNYIYMTDGTMFYYYRGNYSTVENNKFFVYGQNGTDATQGVNLINLDDFILRQNEIGHDEATYPSGCTSAELVELHGCRRILIEYNDLYGAPKQGGVRIKEDFGGFNDDIIVRFNKIHDNNSSYGGKGVYALTRTYQTITNVYVYGNFIYNNYMGGVIGGDGVNGYYIWSNIIVDNLNGITLYMKDGAAISNVYISNNTITYNSPSGDSTQSGINITAGTVMRIKNNILWNNRVAGGSYYQIYSTKSLAALEHDTYYHSVGTPTIYYEGSARTLAVMQGTYNLENDNPAGEITDPGFINPDGTDEIYGTADDDYRLDGTHINNGGDISQCFNVTIQGSGYEICFEDVLDPDNTDWTTTPPTVATVKQGTYGTWERGAYAYIPAVVVPYPPYNLRVVE